MNLIDKVNQKYASANVKEFPQFRPGDTVSVHVKITEGDKSRIQVFKGICVGIKHAVANMNGHFRVRKISAGVGVERVFPFHCPSVTKIIVDQKGQSRRAKHYYLRERTGKEARIAIDYERE